MTKTEVRRRQTFLKAPRKAVPSKPGSFVLDSLINLLEDPSVGSEPAGNGRRMSNRSGGFDACGTP